MAVISNVLIRNEEELEFADFSGSTFVGRYPGSLANGIMISVADNATFSTWPFAYLFEYTPRINQLSIAVVDTTGKIKGTGSAYQEFSISLEKIRTPSPAVTSQLKVGEVTVEYSTSDTIASVIGKIQTAIEASANLSSKYEITGTKVSGSIGIISFKNLVLGNAVPKVVVDDYWHSTTNITKSGGYGSLIEKYEAVSTIKGTKKEDGSVNYIVDVINRRSNWIYANPATTQFATGDFILDGGVDDYDETLYSGFEKFKNAERYPINYVFGALRPLEKKLIHEVVESRRDCIGFIAPDMEDVVNNNGNEVASLLDFRDVRFNINTTYCFITDNWAQVYDKYNDKYIWIPTCGGTAGLKARATKNFNAWKSPAGYRRGGYLGYSKLAWSAEKEQRDELYKVGINSIINAGADGIILLGDKMATSEPTAFGHINVRSAFIVAEVSIASFAKYYLFDNNNADSRSQFLNAVNPFFRKMITQEAFERVESQVDENNNPLDVRQENRFVGNFRIWPQYSINYIDLYFQAEGSTSTTSFDETESN